MGQLFSGADGRRRNLRIALFAIILVTLPFYCLGFILWGAAPQSSQAIRNTATATAPTNTRGPSSTPTATTGFIVTTTLLPANTLPPTPLQFVPPGGVIPILPDATQFRPIFPTFTPVIPTFPPPPPTWTPLPPPPPTWTPIPPATDTPLPLPTSTVIPFFPTDTPAP
jgi:hypothetical protein